MQPQLVWFRQDLRIRDHHALSAAMAEGQAIGIYILDDEGPASHRIGGAQRWWLHHSLAALRQSLAELGVPLVLRRGQSASELERLVTEAGGAKVHAHHHYEPWWQAAEREAAQRLDLALHHGNLLANPRAILNQSGERYRVFTPWFRKLLEQMPPALPLPVPQPQSAPLAQLASDNLDDWALLPRNPDWSGGFDAWKPGERGARAALREFLPELADYEQARNFPSQTGTSRLSPHIHFGEISPASIWHHALAKAGAKARSYLSE
ncbi:MAG: deoxyribodipyrimidine photo-lyase, partial [Betaproteobacteria bacterium]|nr:deoxyribodipyrimidine photo-lyase [Betaproteobacteria bacterium]